MTSLGASAVKVKNYQKPLKWKVLLYPSYCSDLVVSDYF